MREIKFRAWQQYEMRMFQVTSLEWDANIFRKFHKMALISLDDLRTIRSTTGAACDNYLLMQSTGLKDRNGAEIYEGDIVRDDRWGCLFEVRWCNGKNEFLRSQLGWILDDHKFSPIGHVEELAAHSALDDPPEREDYYNGEVVGNIYANPELITQKEDVS